MNQIESEEYFLNARKLGAKEYSKSVANGQLGYLPSLEGIIKNSDVVSEINIGLVEIPMKKIVGTYSHLRSLSFAKNFMPLLENDTEFKTKWIELCKAHLDEGIRHSIKVYEYLNWFYVVEGNKRVSVLKYFDAYSIWANVYRLMPKKDDNDINIRIYYEFLKFNNVTGIYSIYFTKEGSFEELLKLIDRFSPSDMESDETKYSYFERRIYNKFRRIYLEAGGQKLSITTGDAFLEYSKVYGIPYEFNDKKLQFTIKAFLIELESMEQGKNMNIQTFPEENIQNSVISTLTTLVLPKKKLKVAFVYARTIETSGWTYAHELGRQHIEQILGDQINTSYVENVPENEEAYKYIKALVHQGNEIIFTTSPVYMNATLKCAIEYPHVKFFNCSEYKPYIHVSNYFGRTYEPRFLTGIIAGAMTKTNTIGYVATSPNPDVISCINAFALGAKMVNPYANIRVTWTNDWNSPIKATDSGSKLILSGADIISNQNIKGEHSISKEFGVYSMLCTMNRRTFQPDKYLAAPIWNWGIFYEKILKNILNGTSKTIWDMFSNNSKVVNFWWGINSGVVDIYYSEEEVPEETQKLLALMRKMIIEDMYHPFSGPIYDQQGVRRVEQDSIISHEQLLTMDWFVDNIEGEIYGVSEK